MKGGVDKATEQDMKIAKQTKLPFENSHILHLFRKIMLAAWRAYQATVINSSLERTTLTMTLAQIRAKLNNNTETFQDFTHTVGKELVTRLQADAMEMRTPRIQPLGVRPLGVRPNENKDDLREEMDLVKSQGK
jgi:hypothetical protein